MNNRIEHLDILKGFAILMVVLGHLVANSSIGGVSNWVNSFHLPLFMFVGGILTYKTMKIDLGLLYYLRNSIYKRAISLLIPYLLWSIILYTFIRGSLSFNLIENLKLYLINPPTTVLWFLYTYFFLSIIFSIYLFGLKILGANKFYKDVIIIFLLFIISFLAQTYLPIIPRNLAVFFPYFFFGVLFSKYDFIENISNNKYIISLCTIAFVFASFQYGRYENQAINLMFKIVSGICGSLSFYYIFKRIMFNAKIKSMLTLFGENSIIIYIVHFTMLFSLSNFINPIFGNNIDFFVLIIALLISILISYSCVLVGNVFKQIPLLDGLLFGRWKLKKLN